MTAHYFQNARREMTRFLPREYTRVLEIGCGEGHFLAELRADSEKWGVEPVEAAAAAAARRIDHVVSGPYESVADQLPKAFFDLVICNDVLEHMVDPEGFLDSIQAKMTGGAFLVGSVPNVRYVAHLFELLIRRDWQYKAEGILDRTHLRFFTAKSLRRLLLSRGFEIEAFAGINSILALPITPRAVVRNVLVVGIEVFSLGFHSDTRFLQFGFRARLQAATRRDA